MTQPVAKADFLADLRAQIRHHCATVSEVFQPLDAQRLAWRPEPKAWSIAQCFDHLNLTHDYYRPKIAGGLGRPQRARPDRDTYAPSFWGRIYMFFAFNPRYSFPAADAIAPAAEQPADVFAAYLARQDALEQTLAAVDGIDLRATRIPVEKGVSFNLGDCLKILVYHDTLHIGQAHGVLTQMRLRGERQARA